MFYSVGQCKLDIVHHVTPPIQPKHFLRYKIPTAFPNLIFGIRTTLYFLNADPDISDYIIHSDTHNSSPPTSADGSRDHAEPYGFIFRLVRCRIKRS